MLAVCFLKIHCLVIVANTDRLTLSKVTLKDAPLIYELMNSPRWIKYIGDRNIKTINDARGHIKKIIIQSYEQNGFGFYKVVLKESKEATGICGLIKRTYLSYPDIGFALLPQFEGKGYGFESANKLKNIASDEFGIEILSAITTKINFSSQKLLEKLGFKLSGTTRLISDGEELLVYKFPPPLV